MWNLLWETLFPLVGVLVVALLLVAAALLMVAICSSWRDRWIYNGGTCRANGLPWEVLTQSDGRVRLRAGGRERVVGNWMTFSGVVQR